MTRKRNRTIYWGLFLKGEDAEQITDGLGHNGIKPYVLDRIIRNQHVTFGFGTEPDDGFKDIGDVSVKVIGYAEDGRNEGIEIELPPAAYKYYHGADTLHMTLSVANGAKPVDTAHLCFTRLDDPFTVCMYPGAFRNGHVVSF